MSWLMALWLMHLVSSSAAVDWDWAGIDLPVAGEVNLEVTVEAENCVT